MDLVKVCRLEEMEWLMTRETVRDTPQYHIMRLSGKGTKPGLRQLSAYSHPYPTLRELQKEIIRYSNPLFTTDLHRQL